MSRFKPVLFVLFAVFAVSAVMVASASASEHEWLVSGASIAAGVEEPMTAEGELLLEDMEAGTDVLCSGFLDGFFLAGGLDLITKALALDKVTEAGIECSFILRGSCEEGMAPLVTAIHLPWLTELFLDTSELILDLILEHEAGVGLPGYLVECLVLGLTFDDQCEGESSADVKNNVTAGDVEAEFSHTDELVTPPGFCSFSLKITGLVGSEDAGGTVLPSLMTLNNGLTLSIN